MKMKDIKKIGFATIMFLGVLIPLMIMLINYVDNTYALVFIGTLLIITSLIVVLTIVEVASNHIK